MHDGLQKSPQVQVDSLRSVIFWLIVTGLLIGMVAAAYYIVSRPSWNPDSVTYLALVISGLSAAMVAQGQSVPLLGFVGVYLGYVIVSHLGVAGVVAFFPDALDHLTAWEVRWFYTPYRPIAVAMAGLGIGATALGAGLCWRLDRRSAQPVTLAVAASPGLYAVGTCLLLWAAWYLVSAVLSGTLTLFGSYKEYREAMWGGSFHYVLFCLSVGLAFAVAAGNPGQRRVAIGIFLIPGVILALTGHRSSVLFPAAVATAVYYTRGYRLRVREVVAIAAMFFVFIPLAKEVRSEGIAHTEWSSLSLSWTEPFLINGWTLRPVVFTVDWFEHGEAHGWGGSYLLPATRMVGAITPFVKRPAYEGHPNYLRDRTLNAGYSVIAEAYYNFGLVGIVVIMSAVGALLARLGDRAHSGAKLALAAGLLAVLINHVRNHGVFVPAQTCGVVVLWIVGVSITPAMRRWLMTEPRRRVQPRVSVVSHR